MDKRPIGIMDSGLGGLSVIRIMNQQLPHEKLIFVGDQGHFPYGTRTQQNVCHLALNIGQFFKRQNVKMMIVACNTATAAALPTLQAKMPFPVIGMIAPGAKGALQQAHHHSIGVIGTASTIENHAYEKKLHQLDTSVQVVEKAAQPLVSIVEHGQTGTVLAKQTVDEQLAVFDQQPVETLILGCTHFPFLAAEIQQKLGNQVTLVDPAKEAVNNAQEWLIKHDALNDTTLAPQSRLYSTGDVAVLKAGAEQWLNSQNYTCAHLEL
ncbi:glutamate racemase [Limosilactobacillus mucosae]|uniref:glutamate racemase n=1 Tax=Limosilactobacillus mucosae TaxID=97478 RepID=UPI00399515F8